jgi:group II intron reverse transcriptase/maturase
MVSSVNLDSQSWKALPWKKFERHLFGLQVRVFKAKRTNDKKRVRSLQKLILNSQSVVYLSIRQVTQLNEGKRTAGIDGKAMLSEKERFKLAHRIFTERSDWRHSRLKRINIPKADGSVRPLKIPTIADRAWQCLVKNVMEPAHEATFHANSYGFRPGRCTHDIQKLLFLNLNTRTKGIDKRVLKLDIEKCFDRISHRAIMEKIDIPNKLKLGIFRCLKAGVDPEFPEQGTPQGGVISPLLANVVLDGIEGLHRSFRYADDMILILRNVDDEEMLLAEIDTFLMERGLRINRSKTSTYSTLNGFDFLGWHFKCLPSGKFRCVPSEENFKKFRKKVKTVINSSNLDVATKVSKLAPIVRGWRQYHKFCKMDGSRFSLWGMANRACKVFNTKKRNKTIAVGLTKAAFPSVPYSENRFINVAGDRSIYDGDLTYWAARNSKRYDNYTAKALKRQSSICVQCGLKIIGDQRTHLHHIDGNHSNWKLMNLNALHKSCHINLHADSQKLKS